MRPVRLLAVLLIGLAACGGSSAPSPSAAPSSPAAVSPSPTIDAEPIRHTLCLDLLATQRILINSLDDVVAVTLAPKLDDLQLAFETATTGYADAGVTKTATLTARLATETKTFAAHLRGTYPEGSSYDPQAAISDYSGFVDGLFTELPKNFCLPEQD